MPQTVEEWMGPLAIAGLATTLAGTIVGIYSRSVVRAPQPGAGGGAQAQARLARTSPRGGIQSNRAIGDAPRTQVSQVRARREGDIGVKGVDGLADAPHIQVAPGFLRGQS